MKGKNLLILLMALVLISGVMAQVKVAVNTDKSEYAAGENILVSVYLSPDGIDSQPFYDVNLYVKSNDNGKFVSFNGASCAADTALSVFSNPKFSPTWECSKAGSYISTDGAYYGMWVFGTLGNSPYTLTRSKAPEKLTYFTIQAKNLTLTQAQALGAVSGSTSLEISPLVRNIYDYSGTTPIQLASSTSPAHISKTISIFYPCVRNADCGSGNFCVLNRCEQGGVGSKCGDGTQCDNGNYCVNQVCQDGNVNSPCSGDTTCDVQTAGGYFCVNGLCSSGNEGSACVDTADCLGSALTCTNGICSKSVDPICVGAINPNDCDGDGILNADDKCPNSAKDRYVFSTGNLKGCMKSDVNLNEKVESLDIIDFIDAYNNKKLSEYPGIDLTQSGTIDSLDIIDFIYNYNNKKQS